MICEKEGPEFKKEEHPPLSPRSVLPVPIVLPRAAGDNGWAGTHPRLPGEAVPIAEHISRPLQPM